MKMTSGVVIVLSIFFSFSRLTTETYASTSLYVADPGQNEVREYDAQSGQLLYTYLVDWATDAAVSPGGNLYVASQTRAQADYAEIVKIDLQTRQQTVFATTGIEGIFSVAFGPNGNLFASSTKFPTYAKVSEYDGITGAVIRTVVPGSGSPAPGGLAFTNNGNLLVGWYNEIREYDGITGAFIRSLPGSIGLGAPNGITISPSGSIVVAYTSAGIYEFDETDGSLLRSFATDLSPVDVTFASDGNLFVSVNSNQGSYGDAILRFDWATGNLLGYFAPGGGHGLTFGPRSLAEPLATLTISKTGTGSGKVTSSPAGIDCGGTCSAQFTQSTAVTLTATPNANSTFAGWSGDPGCYGGVVTMDADKTCTATFNLVSLTAPSGLGARAISSSSIRLVWTDNSKNEAGFEIERKAGKCDSSAAWRQIAQKVSNTTFFTDTGLVPGTTYSYRVKASNADLHSLPSNCFSATTGKAGTPNSPSNLRATAIAPRKINLSWNDNSANETYFVIYRRVGTGQWQLFKIVSTNVTGYSDSTAALNGSVNIYAYYVQACNAGGCSPASSLAGVPFRPAALKASNNAGSVDLTWSVNKANEDGFQIFRKNGACSEIRPWAWIATAATDAASFKDTNVRVGEVYSYKVRAFRISPLVPYAFGYSLYSNCVEITVP